MIRRLLIKNFQKHKKLDLKLGKITTFIGPTDAGKSAIIRALRWLFFNKPNTTGLARWGTTSTVVKAKVEGHTITRQKGKANTYKLNDEEYRAFGAGVPPAISDILNLSELNIQQQAEAHFWLSDTPGQVGRSLNKIVDLSIIDYTINELQKRSREAKTKKEVAVEAVGHAEVGLAALSNVPAMCKAAKQLNKAHAATVATTARHTALLVLVTAAHKKHTTATHAADKYAASKKLLVIAKRLQNVDKKHGLLQKLLTKAIDLNSCTNGGLPNTHKLDDTYRRRTEASHDYSSLYQYMILVRRYTVAIEEKQQELEDKQKKLENEWKECPLCHQTL